MLVDIDVVLERIRVEIQERHRNQSAFAQHVGISRSHLSHILAGRKDPTERMLQEVGIERLVVYRVRR